MEQKKQRMQEHGTAVKIKRGKLIIRMQRKL